MEADYWRELVMPVVAGRKIVLTGAPVAGQGARVDEMRGFGATDVFVLGEGMGTGPLPDSEWFALDVAGASIMEALRSAEAALSALPTGARDALDRFDPDGSALVIGSFLNVHTEVAGRACLSWRRPEWIALEDKVVVDELWDAAGVERVRSRVVAVDDLKAETGVVWAGDARDGFHGGADLTRWLRTDADVAPAQADMRTHCDRVRVMPFLDGIPCSIHGIVFDDYVAALRPIEMVTLRRGSAFFYGGAATYWDPRDEDREAMCAVARRVGDELRRRVDFRGAFTVDGVMTADGFRPTELNPRMGAGLSQISYGVPELPIDLLNQAVIARRVLDYRPAEFEQFLLENADARRSGGTWRAVPVAVPDTGPARIAWTGEAWRWASEDEPSDARCMSGPSTLGGFVRLSLAPARTPAGPSIAPRAAAFYAFCDRELGTNIGPLEAAPDVRT